MELSPYFLGPNFFWRPDLVWKQSMSAPTNDNVIPMKCVKSTTMKSIKMIEILG